MVYKYAKQTCTRSFTHCNDVLAAVAGCIKRQHFVSSKLNRGNRGNLQPDLVRVHSFLHVMACEAILLRL